MEIMTYIETIHRHAQLGFQRVIIDNNPTIHRIAITQIEV